MKKAIVCGGAGFIGHHLSRRLMENGYYVICLDIKNPDFCKPSSFCHEFYIHDCSLGLDAYLKRDIDEVYQLAADMGGAGYIFSGKYDADIMANSSLINIQVLKSCLGKIGKIFYSSSACVYPEYNQKDPENPVCSEDSVYPAQPDSEYGWEKLFSERLYMSFSRNHNLPVAIARFHNVYGPECVFDNGKEKAVLATCRKVIQQNHEIEVWGTGSQTRSFLYIDDCVDGIKSLMESSYAEPLNVGSAEKISIDELTEKVIKISGKNLAIKHIVGPVGVNGRNSDNRLVTKITGWTPKYNLDHGLEITYNWLKNYLKN